MDEPRKASEIILSLESKVEQLIKLHQALDFNVKLISNKLNDIIAAVNNAKPVSAPSFTVEAPKTIAITKENQLPIENAPIGFRRTSRPETFTPTSPGGAEIKLAPIKPEPPAEAMAKEQIISTPSIKSSGSVISVQQRITDNSGKAVFLANIEIIDKQSKNVVFKGRTNGIGKYAASLPIGEYQVSIKKAKSLEKPEINELQNLIVDGAQNPLNLPLVIIK